MFSTYHKAHDKFMADRRDDWQTVGDIAYFDEDGFYYICDRKKDMIISGGVNIYPAEIEAALEAHPDIIDVAVFGIPDDEWGEAVHAIVVVRPGADADERADRGLRARASRRLQGAALLFLHDGDPAHRIGQDPEARTPQAVLGRPQEQGLRLVRMRRIRTGLGCRHARGIDLGACGASGRRHGQGRRPQRREVRRR